MPERVPAGWGSMLALSPHVFGSAQNYTLVAPYYTHESEPSSYTTSNGRLSLNLRGTEACWTTFISLNARFKTGDICRLLSCVMDLSTTIFAFETLIRVHQYISIASGISGLFRLPSRLGLLLIASRPCSKPRVLSMQQRPSIPP